MASPVDSRILNDVRKYSTKGDGDAMKIRSIYETHLEVSDMDRSIEFYQSLGLKLAYVNVEKTMAFFWVGKAKEQMLGLWRVAEGKAVVRQHFAFGVTLDDLIQSKDWLAEKGIEVEEDFGLAPIEPLVHTWMPAACYYFRDPDGNSLEFISVLDDEPSLPARVVYLSEWNRMHQRERAGSASTSQ
jgi:lactoylglutathione lyase